MSAPGFIADFDSASAMLRANARFLYGRDFPHMGMDLPARHLIPLGNVLPDVLRNQVYTWSGWAEAIPEARLADIDIEDASRWAVAQHPPRRYPAIAIGSSNGAAVHLFAALGIPWLPQTWLIPVRRHGVHPDDMRADMEWGASRGRRLLDANPDLQLHHMHDPNQDRLMIRHMTYFRVKRRQLGQAYRRFIEESLEPGGRLIVVECEQRWPTVTIGDRHWFQPGAMGGATAREYVAGSQRVAGLLAREDSPRSQWPRIETTGEQPEAEWGFAPALLDDAAALAASRGYRLQRLRFDSPEDLSPFVADLHRWWYRRMGWNDRRLLGDSFILMDPYWTLRTGAVPWWALFGTDPSADRLHAYVADDEFDEIYLMLFSHGVESIGVAGIGRWREILSHARRRGEFVGVDEKRFPRDFATLARYHDELPRRIRQRRPFPVPLALSELDEFAGRASGRYGVRLESGGDDRIRTGE